MRMLIIVLVALLTVPSFSAEQKVYIFDFGKTLVDHGKFDSATETFVGGMWYREGTHKYLTSLKSAGHVVLAMINIPENWGATYELKKSKLIDVAKKSWTDEIYLEGFNWQLFDEIILPIDDAERKKIKGNTDIYERGLLVAGGYAPDAEVVYIGENDLELEQAASVGMSVWKVSESGRPVYPVFTKFKGR